MCLFRYDNGGFHYASPTNNNVSPPLAGLCDHSFSHRAEADTEKMTFPVLGGLVFGGVVNNNDAACIIGQRQRHHARGVETEDMKT